LIEVKDKYIKTLHRFISSKIVMLENQSQNHNESPKNILDG